MKEAKRGLYLKWYEDIPFGESLKTNLRHYTYNRKSEDFYISYNGQEAVLLAGALHAMDSDKRTK
jgi:TPP-dependent pyruvate/acetoin dehydrogenase alpha subunit